MGKGAARQLVHQLEAALRSARQVLGAAAPAPISLASFVGDFIRWSRDDCHNSEPYVREQERFLRWWAIKLAGVDVAELDVAGDVEPLLRGQLARQQRIAALKRFVSYLVQVRRVLAYDPLTLLKVPQSTPAQWRRPKTQDRAHVLRTLAELPLHHRARLAVLCGTGWHVTELRRFARAGRILRRGAKRILETLHKSGEPHRVQVSVRVAAAAERVRELGDFHLTAFRRAVRSAARRAGRAWTPGSMRHSVATFAVDAGADVRSVGDFLGHKDPRTTRRFYATYAVPRRVPTLL